MNLPTDHPKIKPAKIGIVLANLGTPDATDYWSMRRYLSEFLSDKRVVDYSAWLWQPLLQGIILTRRPFSSGAAYRSIWNNELNESPLLTTTRLQANAVKKEIELTYGDNVIVDFAMRYGNPSTGSVIKKLKDQGVEKLVFFPLYPQYAGPTTATANDEAFRTLMKMNWQPSIRTVPAYFDNPLYINALANSVKKKYKSLEKKPDILVCSYHGVPVRYLMEGDPYHCQCQKTTRLLKEALGWEDTDIKTTFQSKFGPEKWLQPYTVEEVARLAEGGKKNIAIMSPAFSSDCVETLEEINEEIFESFEEAGGETFTYIECLNDSDDHIKMMMGILKNELSGWVD
ncbi:ferrochelatase [Amylibacter sp.]|jgi:ferrochelatase|nr:ferrochelatase [Amylibacter sp.]MDB4188298.1 ferrochelatase [bacterium]MDA8761646.1 ferrochelatase [Amylibacter sp.]MDA9004632.1 ferrochelatase [Amylibacter sp.]MDA9074820.1 ferrochelatase [Amylibacter sp.]|tara:strand:+ start:832 stop:1860 length:1029 start_codon:yes stop_codon:yes gene_type:complete